MAAVLRLQSKRRAVVSQALRELAGLTVGALVLNRVVADDAGPLWLFLTGVAAWVVLVGLAVAVTNGNTTR